MSQLILFEDAQFTGLLPLVYWRCTFELRCGRKSLLDNAAFALARPVGGIWVREWIGKLAGGRCQVPVNQRCTEGTVLLNGRWLLTGGVEFPPPPFVAMCGDAVAYIVCDRKLAESVSPELMLDPAASAQLASKFPSGEVKAALVRYPWDIVDRNADILRYHWTGDDRSTDGVVSSSAHLVNPNRIHIGERTRIRPTAVINAESGPVYISHDVLVDAHTYIEGPAYVGPGCVLRPNATVGGGTTLGTQCTIGGEVTATIMSGWASKAFDGFLGHAYVGVWAHFGAGASNSNFKNTYGPVRVQHGDALVETDHQCLGCVAGDFSRLGIGQLLPTGAIVGVGAMVATGGFAPKFVRSLSWLTAQVDERVELERLLETARRMMAQRHVSMSEDEEVLFRKLPALTQQFGV